MGVICSGSSKQQGSPVEQMLRKNNMNLLLDQWPASFIFLLKQKFQGVAYFEDNQRVGKKSREGLDFQAFMKLFPRLTQQPQDIQLRAFNSFDIDKSCRIDFKEFCFVLSLIINSDESQRTAFIFQLYDFDSDQALNRGEFKYFLKFNYQYILLDQLEKKNEDLVDKANEGKPLEDIQMQLKKEDTSERNTTTLTKVKQEQLINKIISDLYCLNQPKSRKIKINLGEFQAWIYSYFDSIKFFEIFELVPGPLKEREVIRQIMKTQGEEKSLSQKHYYVISYKWWELWRFYINYSFAQKHKPEQSQPIDQQVQMIKLNLEEQKKLRQSRRQSNVSLVDLDLANSIPNEMKEDHSITRKIQKTNNQHSDNMMRNIRSPGKLLRNARGEMVMIDPNQPSPQFSIDQLEIVHRHSQSYPAWGLDQIQENNLNEEELPIPQFYHNLQEYSPGQKVYASYHEGQPKYPNFNPISKQFQQIQNKVMDNESDPMASYNENFQKQSEKQQSSDQINAMEFNYEIDQPQKVEVHVSTPRIQTFYLDSQAQHPARGEELEAPELDFHIPNENVQVEEEKDQNWLKNSHNQQFNKTNDNESLFINQENHQRQGENDQHVQGEFLQGQQGQSIKEVQHHSPVTDPLRNPPVDCKILRYGICETEDNEDPFYQKNSLNNTFGMINNDECNMQTLRPGQIDNSDIQGEFDGELKLNILNNHDYVLVPEEAWFSLVQWYGYGSSGIQVYRRKVFQDVKRNLNILDMYPPLLKGYICDIKGEIMYTSRVVLMISNRKNMTKCFNKFNKRMKLGKPNQYIVYFKRIGDTWQEVTNMDNTLIDYQIESGTFIVFVQKKLVATFKKIQKLSDSNTFDIPILNRYETQQVKLGDQYDVLHPVTNEWLLCHVCDILKNGIKFHIKKQVSSKEFLIENSELQRRVELPGQKSKQDIRIPLMNQKDQIPGLSIEYPGLGNQGNTCFINTIIQCLIHTPLFGEYILNEGYLDDLVIKKKPSGLSNQSKPCYLVVELQKLMKQMKSLKLENQDPYSQNTIIPYDLKKAIDIILPQFSGYEQHDAQEFFSIFVDTVSDELKRQKTLVEQKSTLSQTEQYSSVIQELFMGKTVNELECLTCHYKSIKYEDFATLSLPIPISEELNFEVTFVRRCTKSIIPPLKKYGIKVSKYGTLKEFIQEFEKVSGVPHIRFEFCEVYRNSIHKTFYGIDTKTTIRHLGLKPYDEIFAYEILKQAVDIEDEANELMTLTSASTQWKVDDFVDVQDQQGDWKYGQVTDIRDRGFEKVYRVQIRYEKAEIQPWIGSSTNQLAQFRTKALQKKAAQIYNVINRIYNEATDTLEKFSLPFIVTGPQWLTWREFRTLIFNQAKRYIDFSYVKKKQTQLRFSKESKGYFFQDAENSEIKRKNFEKQNLLDKHSKYKSQNQPEQEERNDHQAQSVYLGNSYENDTPQQNSHKIRQMKQSNYLDEPQYLSMNQNFTQYDVKTPPAGQIFRAFQPQETFDIDVQQFLSQPDFPYRLRLIDQSTWCCITCDKPISYNKTFVSNKYCKVCEYGMSDAPISLNIPNNSQPLVVLDWIDSLAFNPLSTQYQHDESYTQLKKEKFERKDRISQEQCFDLFTEEEKIDFSCEKCNSLQPATTKFYLSSMPNILVLHLKRFQFRDGFLEKIDNDIDFPLKNLNLKKWIYLPEKNNQESINKTKEKEKLYELYAVANHIGNGKEGHYISYVNVQHDGKELWVSFDDDTVKVVNQERVMSQYTYLLFYKRKEFSSSAIINLTFKSFNKKKPIIK